MCLQLQSLHTAASIEFSSLTKHSTSSKYMRTATTLLTLECDATDILGRHAMNLFCVMEDPCNQLMWIGCSA